MSLYIFTCDIMWHSMWLSWFPHVETAAVKISDFNYTISVAKQIHNHNIIAISIGMYKKQMQSFRCIFKMCFVSFLGGK